MALERTLTTNEQKAREQLCLALDGIETLDEVRSRVSELKEYVGMFKVGKELHTRFGNDVIDAVHEAGGEIFLDLKVYDIPETMKKTAKAITEKGVYMFNVHASAGERAMEYTMQGVQEGMAQYGTRKPKVLGVTVLTSFGEDEFNKAIYRQEGTIEDTVKAMTHNVHNAGLEGIVCSPSEVTELRKENLPDDLMYVTPGIKGPDGEVGSDQNEKRIKTPKGAIENGSSVLVVGRAINGGATAQERQDKAYAILQDMAMAYEVE